MKNKNHDLLKIENLCVKVNGKIILKNINLVIKKNENVVLLGANGQGKSTLLLTIMGHPKCIITSGNIFFNDKNITKLDVNERSKIGIFLGFQNPVEIPGVNNGVFLKNIFDIHNQKIGFLDFYEKIKKICNTNKIEFEKYHHRNLNENFSGGEKKINEILQMMVIKPKFAMLDEIDSGLDVDASKKIASIINQYCEKYNANFLVVSHYVEFINMLKIDKLLIMSNETILEKKKAFLKTIHQKGFEWMRK